MKYQYSYTLLTPFSKEHIESEFDTDKEGSLDYFLAKIMQSSSEVGCSISNFKYQIDYIKKDKETDFMFNNTKLILLSLNDTNNAKGFKNSVDYVGKWNDWELVIYERKTGNKLYQVITKCKPHPDIDSFYNVSIINGDIYNTGVTSYSLDTKENYNQILK